MNSSCLDFRTLRSCAKLPLVAALLLAPLAHLNGTTPPPGDSDPYPYSRYGDFKSAQLRSTSTHGYGLYLVEMQMSLSPSVSTFWLYADSPSTQYMQDVSQLWRWNEIDFEFVPYTESTQAEYFTFEWSENEIKKDSITRYAAISELSSILANTPNTSSQRYASWVSGLIRTDEVVAEQVMNAQAMGTSYTAGPPTGGTFSVIVEQPDGSSVSSGAIAYDADITEVTTALTTMSDGKAFLHDLLPSGFVVVPAGAAGGAVFDTTTGSTTIQVNNDPGLLGQISPGDAVSQPGSDGPVIPAGTTVVSVDRTGSSIEISNAATGTESNLNLNFTPASSWTINFNGGTTLAPDQMPNIYLDLSSLTGTGDIPILGRLTPGLTSTQETTGFGMRVFLSPLTPASGQSWVEYLAANTGPGKTFGDATQWKYPVATLATPESLPMSRMGTVNFWRMPVGDASVTLDFDGYGTFDRTGIYRGSLPGATDPNYFTSEPFNNEAFYWDSTGAYDPYTDIYTYVITWTPTRMAQYLLPRLERDNNGLPIIDIDGLEPLVEYDLADYPSLAQSGPQGTPGQTPGTSGGTIPFTYTELAEHIGNVSLNLANYVGYNQSGSGANGSATVSATVSSGSLNVSNVNSFGATVSVTQASTLGMLSAITGGTPAAGMVITSDDTDLIPAATSLTQVWPDAYLITMSAAATGSGTATVTLKDTTSGASFSASGVLSTSSPSLVLYDVPGGNTPANGMTITTASPGLLPDGVTVSATSTQNTVVEFNQAPPQTGSGSAYLFNLITTTEGQTVSWLPQSGQLVSGTNIPEGSSVGAVAVNGTSFTLVTPGNVTPTGSASSITLGTAPAGAGWSGPAPARDLADSDAYVRSAGFFAWTGGEDNDGSQTSDFDISLPSDNGNNFWVDFSDTTTWTSSTWQVLITRYFNLGYTNNFTHLGAETNVSLQYPNISPANISLETITLPDSTQTQVLALTVGANDLTLNTAGDNWQTPPNLNFYQVSANAPSGQISSTNPLLRVEVHQTGNKANYWTANSPVLSPTYIFAPPSGQTVDLTVNLWVLDSGTPPVLNIEELDTPALPDYTATIQLSNPTDGPTFTVTSDPHGIMATASGRFIQVQSPAKPKSGENVHPVSVLNDFTLARPGTNPARDPHPKGKGTLRPLHSQPTAPWYFSAVYGYWYAGEVPWVYSLDLRNWLYTHGSSTADLWLWIPPYGWAWASEYPYLYIADREGWFYFDFTGWLYDFNNETWEPLQ